MIKAVALLVSASFIGSPAIAQPQASPDGASVASVVHAVYESLSGEANQHRNWDRFRALFSSEGRIITVIPSEKGTAITNSPATDFITRIAPMSDSKTLYEREVKQTVSGSGRIATVVSYVESRHQKDAASADAHGMNIYQLVNDGTRWWITSMTFEPSTSVVPLP